MKIYFNLIIFFFCISLPATSAQFNLGLEAGLNRSNTVFSGSPDIKHAASLYYFGSAVPSYTFKNNMSLHMHLGYSAQGYSLQNISNLDLLEFKYHYLHVSPEIAFQVNKFIGLGLGIYGAYKTSEYNRYPGEDWVKSGSGTNSFYSFFNYDFGVNFSIKPSYKQFYLRLMYKHGLSDILEISFVDENGQNLYDEISTINFLVGIGYLMK